MTDDREATRDFTRALFGRRPDDEAEQNPPATPPNHVPSEGTNPAQPRRPTDMREFLRALFRTTD
jgi:hypothetical protein